MTRKIKNADGMYPYKDVPWEVYFADLKAQGIVDPLDIDVQLPRVLKHARADSRTAIDPAIRADAKAIIHFIQRLKKGMRQWLETPALTPLYMEGVVEWAVGIALEIGRLDERCRARRFEPLVVRVNSTTRKLREAAREQQHDPATIDKAIHLFNRLMRIKPRPKKETVYREVKEKTGIPGRTLRRHLAERKAAGQ